MKFFLLCICMVILSAAGAQHNKKAEKLYDIAIGNLQEGDISIGISNLFKTLAIEPAYMEANISLASAYSEMKKYDSSVIWFSKAQNIDFQRFQNYLLPYSIALAGTGNFAEAMEKINQFLTIPNLNERSIGAGNYRKKCYAFALDYAKRHPNDNYIFKPVNMGDNINSGQSEYYPSFNFNDSIFVFTRRNGKREDFYESIRTKDSIYPVSTKIKGAINDEPSKGAINISQDGDWLIFAGNFANQGYGNFDLYISYATAQGWSDPVNLGPNINSEFWESSPSLSADKSTLYFSSARPGGFGGADLYVSYHLPNGQWTAAKNLGSKINTIGEELAPFIHVDNQTLYFTSDGLPGYGGTDLFLVRKQPDGNFGTPANLGYPINTIDNEGSLSISSNGVIAFCASDRTDSRGGLDLYKFELRDDVRPLKTVFVRGKILDKATNTGLPAVLELSDNATQQMLSRSQSDQNGNYLLTLPTGKSYTVTINSKGYLFQSEVYDLRAQSNKVEERRDFLLEKIKVQASLTLKNIQFATNSFQLEPVSLIELQKVLLLLQENPSLKIRINGHTDNVGSATANQILSVNRAKSVVEYLTKQNIDPRRLEWKGYGATVPIAPNTTEEGKALNRRTEVEVIGI